MGNNVSKNPSQRQFQRPLQKQFHNLTKHISIQKKLFFGAALISAFLLGLLVFALFEFGRLNDGFENLLNQSKSSQQAATETASKIDQSNAELVDITGQMGKLSEDILRTNQTVKLLERNVNGFAVALGDMIAALEKAAKDIPESETLYLIEDVIDQAGDTENTIRRQGLVNLGATVNNMENFRVSLADKVAGVRDLSGGLQDGKALSQSVQQGNTEIAEMAQEFGNEITFTRNTMILLIVVIVLLTFISLMFLAGALVAPLKQAIVLAEKVSRGDLDTDVDIDGSDETAQMLTALDSMQQTLKQVIRTDIQGLIDSANAGDLSKRADQSELAGCYGELVGGVNELVSVNEQVVSELVSVLAALSKGEMNHRVEGDYQGSFALLKDNANHTAQTLEDIIEVDVNAIVSAAQAGDLNQRIELDGKLGGFAQLCSGINDLVNESALIVADTRRVFGALSQGDLEQRVERDYKGTFAELKSSANATCEQLEAIIQNELQSVVDAARQGDLSKRIGLDDKQGFFASLSLGVNDMVDMNERSMNDVSRVIGSLAEGRLDQRITDDYQGVYAELASHINASLERLDGIVREIRGSADSVSQGTQEIGHGMQDLSQRTESQAAAIEETAASMTQMLETVVSNSRNTERCQGLAHQAVSKASQGGQVVAEAVHAVEEIKSSSQQISEIIVVIDEIAFQTNLLALNAAVEAARAGEQGRGFAVVASEVRSLAQRSAEAAKQIKELINDSVNRVEVGAKLVNESGRTLQEIVESVKTVGELMDTVASASKEQSDGINQVNVAVTQFDNATQQNAALVEETNSASTEIASKARNMQSAISFFKSA